MSMSLVSTLVKAAFKAATGTIHRILTPKSEHKQAKVTKYKQPIHYWTTYQHVTTAIFTSNCQTVSGTLPTESKLVSRI